MDNQQLKSAHILKDLDKEVINLLKKSNLLRTFIKNFLINKLIKDITLTRSNIASIKNIKIFKKYVSK